MQVIIRHPKSGLEYEINSVDFRRGKHYQMAGGEFATYEEAGFKIVSLADGRPDDGPLNTPPSERGD